MKTFSHYYKSQKKPKIKNSKNWFDFGEILIQIRLFFNLKLYHLVLHKVFLKEKIDSFFEKSIFNKLAGFVMILKKFFQIDFE